jgi:hypothetical protein
MKFLSFYRVSVFTSVLLLLLASVLMFAPAQMLTSWGIELTDTLGVLARRLAAVYIGVSAMLFFARNAEPSPAQTAIIYGVRTTCLLLAALGAYEFSVGHVSSGILPAILIEIAIVIGFACVGCACNSKNFFNKN